MKATLYFLLVVTYLSTAVQVSFAQQNTSSGLKTAFQKGTGQLTGSYGFGNGNLLQHRNVVGIQAGYYVADRLMMGVAGSLVREWWNDITLGSKFSAGPLVRYHFTATRVSPFVQLTYLIGNPTFPSIRHQALVFTPGVNLAVLNRFRLEASYGLLFIPYDESIGQPQVGVTALLGGRR